MENNAALVAGLIAIVVAALMYVVAYPYLSGDIKAQKRAAALMSTTNERGNGPRGAPDPRSVARPSPTRSRNSKPRTRRRNHDRTAHRPGRLENDDDRLLHRLLDMRRGVRHWALHHQWRHVGHDRRRRGWPYRFAELDPLLLAKPAHHQIRERISRRHRRYRARHSRRLAGGRLLSGHRERIGRTGAKRISADRRSADDRPFRRAKRPNVSPSECRSRKPRSSRSSSISLKNRAAISRSRCRNLSTVLRDRKKMKGKIRRDVARGESFGGHHRSSPFHRRRRGLFHQANIHHAAVHNEHRKDHRRPLLPMDARSAY